MAQKEDLVDIQEMAVLLGRAELTIRSWIRDGILPKKLQPQRLGGRRKIYWRKSQIEGMKSFAEKKAARRGWQH